MPAIAREKLAQLKRDTTEARLAEMTLPDGAGGAAEGRPSAPTRRQIPGPTRQAEMP